MRFVFALALLATAATAMTAPCDWRYVPLRR
jgi:hypothetical protein